MTTTQHRNEILDRIGDCSYRKAQAALQGAALRGEFGRRRQILALSERYKELREAGRFEEAAVVKAQAYAINETLKQQA